MVLDAVKFLGWLKNFGQNILGPVKGQGINAVKFLSWLKIFGPAQNCKRTSHLSNFRRVFAIWLNCASCLLSRAAQADFKAATLTVFSGPTTSEGTKM